MAADLTVKLRFAGRCRRCQVVSQATFAPSCWEFDAKFLITDGQPKQGWIFIDTLAKCGFQAL